MAVVVPGAMTLRGARTNHNPSTVVLYESADVRRVIPEAKLAAVRTVLQTNCDSQYAIDIGGAVAPHRDGRGFRASFKTMKTEAQFNTFLDAVETAVTT